jgi:hypothetical protein
MKKFLSISFAFLILLSGMHISLATHICGGEVAAVKWSLSEEKASCGMATPTPIVTSQNSIASNCCHNKLSVYSVDNNYNPTSFQVKEITKSIVQVFIVAVSISAHSFFALNALTSHAIPPNIATTSDVSLPEICVFRI